MIASRKNRSFFWKLPQISLNFFLLCAPWLVISGSTQVILTEVMFDPDTLESHNEFVEIYNAGETTVDLQNWKVGDGTEYDFIIDAGYGLYLHPHHFAVILDPSYFENSTTYDALIPATALILTIDDGSFGSYGWSNTKSEPVTFVNSDGDTVQKYYYSVNNPPGYSDEKIIFSDDNSASNWTNSITFRGTPGDVNSVMAATIDLAIDSMWTDPKFPLSGSMFTLSVIFKNKGIQDISTIHVEVYNDLDGDLQADENEIFIQEDIHVHLAYGDKWTYQSSIAAFPAGDHQIGIKALVENDAKPENNHCQFTLRIESEEPVLVINEIMYRPATDQPEWVEFYNKSFSPINLQGWYFADGRDTILISKEEKLVAGNGFIVLSKDSSITEKYDLVADLLVTSSAFPTLNNDFDDLKLLSFSKRLIDRVMYSNSWMKRETVAGTSLERIHPDISSSLADNWVACTAVAGATPGQRNSVYVEKPAEKTLLSVHPNPFSPDADGYEDVAIFEFHLPFATAYITIDIYDMAGRKIKTLINQEPVGPSGNFIWDGTDDRGRISRIGLYIICCRISNLNGEPFKDIKRTLVLMKKA